MQNLLPLALLFATACTSVAPSSKLATELEQLTAGFAGDVGIYVQHLGQNETYGMHEDTLFPTASMIKVPILGALFDKIERGELAYHQQLTYTKDRLYAGEDLLGSFQDGEKVTLDKVAMLMITTSDNTAALWCQELAGTGTTINQWLKDNGFASTRVNSRTDGRKPDQQKYGWGQTTPREMAQLLVKMHTDELVSKAASEEMHRCLSRIYWDGEALSQIPPSVQTISKQGAVNQSRSEAVLVHAPHGDYVFCVITKNQQDQSWGRDNAGYVLLRQVSALLWRHFEPNAPYTPAAGAEKYQ